MTDILSKARRDAQRFTKSGGFQTAISLHNKDNGERCEINGIASVIGITVDQETGESMSGRNAHITFSEAEATEQTYQTRDADNEIKMNGHIVEFKDSTGIERKYKITDAQPDETLGLLYCELEFYEDA